MTGRKEAVIGVTIGIASVLFVPYLLTCVWRVWEWSTAGYFADHVADASKMVEPAPVTRAEFDALQQRVELIEASQQHTDQPTPQELGQ